MEDGKTPPLAELCSTYGIEEATKASNMIFAVKKRLVRALRRGPASIRGLRRRDRRGDGDLARFLSGRRERKPAICRAIHV